MPEKDAAAVLVLQDTFKRAHSAYSNGGFGHTMICSEVFQNVNSMMNESSSPQKQTRKKHKGRHSAELKFRITQGVLERIEEEAMDAEGIKRNKDIPRRQSLSKDFENSIEGIKRESLRMRRSRLEEDVLRLHKRLQDELDLHEAFENALADTSADIPRCLPQSAQELLADIAMLEVTVLKLEEQVVSSHWQLCQERKERKMIQNYTQPPYSSQAVSLFSSLKLKAESLPISDENFSPCWASYYRSLELKQLPEGSSNYAEAMTLDDPFSPATPEISIKSANQYPRCTEAEGEYNQLGAESSQVDFKEHQSSCFSSYAHHQCGNLGLEATGEHGLQSSLLQESPRRLSFPEDEYACCGSPLPADSHDSTTSINTAEEREPLKSKKHHKKRARQKHLELLQAGSKSCPLKPILPATPPQEACAGESSSSSHSFVVKGLTLQPNKLSERMLECMMDIYCHVSDPAAVSSSKFSPFTNISSPTSPFTHTSSISSLSESSPRSFAQSPLMELRSKENVVGSESLFDPYRTREKLSWVDIGIYGSAMEVRWISVRKEQLGYAAQALRNYKLLVEQLAKVDLWSMTHVQKLAFWMNIYNALLMHAYLAYGIPNSELKSFSLMQKASYVIGRHAFTALAIEYHLLKHKPPAHRPQIASLLALHKIKLTMEQSKLAIDYPEPLTIFALSCGARSSPVVKLYTPDNVQQQLKASLHDYIRASVGLSVRGKLLIPKLLYTYAHETMDDASLLDWIYLHLPSSQVSVIQECLQQRRHRFLSSRNFAILPFDFRFQYLVLMRNSES